MFYEVSGMVAARQRSAGGVREKDGVPSTMGAAHRHPGEGNGTTGNGTTAAV